MMSTEFKNGRKSFAVKKQKTFVERLRDAYEKAKKPLSYVVIISIFCLEGLCKVSAIPKNVKHAIELTLIAIFIGIIMEILFKIYEKLVENRGAFKILQPDDLYDEILGLALKSKKVDIKYIGVAGRYGWFPVLAKLLDKTKKDSLHEISKFNIDIALISPDFYEENKNILSKFGTLIPVIEDVKRIQSQLNETNINDGRKKINLYYYNYLPNFIGFLVNDNYLFLNICYWGELANSELEFRAGGTEYLIYDKNDEFGGSRYIERFNGWFNYIKKCTEL